MSLMMFLLAFFYKCKHLTRNQVIPSPLRGLLSFENAAKLLKLRYAYKIFYGEGQPTVTDRREVIMNLEQPALQSIGGASLTLSPSS